MIKWQDKWLLTFNIVDSKCKVMHIGKTNPGNSYNIDGIELPQVEQEKDLGVLLSNTFTWDNHITNCIKKANSCIAWIARSIINRNKDVMLQLYKSMVRPHLEYCVQLWNPIPQYGNWGIIMQLEDVQRRYTRLIDGIGLLTYRERLQKLQITTLLERRCCGDLIETFKITKNLTDYGRDLFQISRTGQHLVAPSNKRNKFQREFFSQRVLSYWNKLPNRVKNCDTVNGFKNNMETYKRKCLKSLNKPIGNFWDLSEEIFSRIDDSNRNSHVEFLNDNPDIARYKRINIH